MFHKAHNSAYMAIKKHELADRLVGFRAICVFVVFFEAKIFVIFSLL